MAEQALASHEGPSFMKQADKQANRKKSKKFNAVEMELVFPVLRSIPCWASSREGRLAVSRDLRSWP